MAIGSVKANIYRERLSIVCHLQPAFPFPFPSSPSLLLFLFLLHHILFLSFSLYFHGGEGKAIYLILTRRLPCLSTSLNSS